MKGYTTPVRVLLVAAMAMAAVGCSQNSAPPAAPVAAPAPPPAPKPPPKPFDGAARVAWYQSCWGFFNDRKWDDFRRCYANDAVAWSSGDGRPDVRGGDAVIADLQARLAATPDMRGEQQLILVNRDKVASISVLHGKNTGPMKDAAGKEIPATGKSFSVLMGHVVDVDNDADQVTSDVGLHDGATVAVQLGLAKGAARAPMAVPKAKPKIVLGTNDDKEQANLAADKAAIAAWNRHNMDTLAKSLAEGYVAHDVTQAKDLDGRGLDQMLYDTWRAFSDARLNARYWTAGEYVVLSGHLEGTNDGDFEPLKAKKTGKKVSVPFLQIDRMAGGKIRETWLFYDGNAMVAQLGVTPGQ